MGKFQITFYRSKIRPLAFAVSPDPTGLVFPDPSQWEPRLTQMADPSQAFEGSELRHWQEAFKRDGYCLLG
jgi:hypothetical protein